MSKVFVDVIFNQVQIDENASTADKKMKWLYDIYPRNSVLLSSSFQAQMQSEKAKKHSQRDQRVQNSMRNFNLMPVSAPLLTVFDETTFNDGSSFKVVNFRPNKVSENHDLNMLAITIGKETNVLLRPEYLYRNANKVQLNASERTQRRILLENAAYFT